MWSDILFGIQLVCTLSNYQLLKNSKQRWNSNSCIRQWLVWRYSYGEFPQSQRVLLKPQRLWHFANPEHTYFHSYQWYRRNSWPFLRSWFCYAFRRCSSDFCTNKCLFEESKDENRKWLKKSPFTLLHFLKVKIHPHFIQVSSTPYHSILE